MTVIRIKELKASFAKKKDKSQSFLVKCWVRTNRDSGKIGFIDAFDGSDLEGIQVVYKKEVTTGFEEAKTVRTGSAIQVEGTINYNDKLNQTEMVASNFKLLKQADEDYPLQKKQHSMEFLRSIAHIKPRAKTIQAITFVRNRCAMAIHKFFQENDFLWISTPLLTSNDCEGAGESFVIKEDPSNPFFTPAAKLTVSGQLNVEPYAQAFGRVYTFGPTFRADRSHTSRHLAEFWMVEPEIAFCELPQMLKIIEAFIKSVIGDVLKSCKTEIDFFAKEKP